MKKNIFLMLLLGCLMLAACGNSEETTANPTKAPKPTQSALATLAPEATTAPIEEIEPTATEVPTPTEIPPESLNPLYQFSYTDPDVGMTFRFPMWYSEYYATGYEDDFMEEAEDIVEPGEQMLCLYDSLIVYNGTSEPLPAKMCMVVGSYISDYYMEGWYNLPGGVVVGTGTREDVLAAYGEPTREQEGVLTYELEPDRYVKLTLQDNILVEVEICNIIPMEENKRNFGYALEELQNFRFRLNDVELQLPITVSDLENAGWEFNEDPSLMSYVIEPEEFAEMARWTKGEFTLLTTSYNNTGEPVKYRDCMIVSIEVNEVDSVPMFGEYSGELILPGDIRLLQSTVYDVQVAYGYPKEEDKDYDRLHYYPGDGMSRISFQLDSGTEKVARIVYVYFPWKRSFGSEAE